MRLFLPKFLLVFFLTAALAATTAYVTNPDIVLTLLSRAEKGEKGGKEDTRSRAQKQADKRIKDLEEATGCRGADCIGTELAEKQKQGQSLSEAEAAVALRWQQLLADPAANLQEISQLNPAVGRQLEEQIDKQTVEFDSAEYRAEKKEAVLQADQFTFTPTGERTEQFNAKEARQLQTESLRAPDENTREQLLTELQTLDPAKYQQTVKQLPSGVVADSSITDALRAKDAREAQAAALTATNDEDKNKALTELAQLTQKGVLPPAKYIQNVTQACGNQCVVNPNDPVDGLTYVGLTEPIKTKLIASEDIGFNRIAASGLVGRLQGVQKTTEPCGGLGSPACDAGKSQKSGCNSGLAPDSGGNCRIDPGFGAAYALAKVIESETAANNGVIPPDKLQALVANNPRSVGQLNQFGDQLCGGGAGICVYSDKSQKFETINELDPRFQAAYEVLLAADPSLPLDQNTKNLIAANLASQSYEIARLNLTSLASSNLSRNKKLAQSGCDQSGSTFSQNGSIWACYDAPSQTVQRLPDNPAYLTNQELIASLFANIKKSEPAVFSKGAKVSTCGAGLENVGNNCVDPQVAAFNESYSQGVLATTMRDHLLDGVPVADWVVDHWLAPMVQAGSPSYYQAAKAQAEVAKTLLANRPEGVSVDEVLSTIDPHGRVMLHLDIAQGMMTKAESGDLAALYRQMDEYSALRDYSRLGYISLFTAAWTENTAASLGQAAGYTQEQAFLNYGAAYADPNATIGQKRASAALFGGEVALTAVDVAFTLVPGIGQAVETASARTAERSAAWAGVRAFDQKAGTLIAAPLIYLGKVPYLSATKYPAVAFVKNVSDNFFGGGARKTATELAEEAAEQAGKLTAEAAPAPAGVGKAAAPKTTWRDLFYPKDRKLALDSGQIVYVDRKPFFTKGGQADIYAGYIRNPNEAGVTKVTVKRPRPIDKLSPKEAEFIAALNAEELRIYQNTASSVKPKFYGVGENGDLILEYVEGKPLNELLETATEEEEIELLKKLRTALDTLHRDTGLPHGDLNFMGYSLQESYVNAVLTPEGEIKFLDQVGTARYQNFDDAGVPKITALGTPPAGQATAGKTGAGEWIDKNLWSKDKGLFPSSAFYQKYKTPLKIGTGITTFALLIDKVNDWVKNTAPPEIAATVTAWLQALTPTPTGTAPPPPVTQTPTNTAVPPTATAEQILTIPVSQKPGSLTLTAATTSQEKVIAYLTLLVNSYNGPENDPEAFAAYIRKNLENNQALLGVDLSSLPKGANNRFSESYDYYETQAIIRTFFSIPGQKFQCGDWGQLMEIIPGLNPPHISGYGLSSDDSPLVWDIMREINNDPSRANRGRLDGIEDFALNRAYVMGENLVYRFDDPKYLKPGDVLVNSNDDIDHMRILVSNYNSPQGEILVFTEANSPVDGNDGSAQLYAILARNLYQQIGIGDNNEQAMKNTLVMRLYLNEAQSVNRPVPDATEEILQLLNQ